MDAFSGTPLIGIIPYTPNDIIPKIQMPDWLSHWPEYIPNRDNKNDSMTLKSSDFTLLKRQVFYSEITDENRSRYNSASSSSYEKTPGEKFAEDKNNICIFGARQNNLKNINVKIPMNKLTVITGVSGSGKTSLAFDTLFAEGRRRFLHTLSPAAAQAAGIMEKPDFLIIQDQL